jgi:hypothetical protein
MRHEVTILSGELVDVPHIATVHGGGSSSHVSLWTAERYEIWIRPDSDDEVRSFVGVSTRLDAGRGADHVFLDLGCPREEAENLGLRAEFCEASK